MSLLPDDMEEQVARQLAVAKAGRAARRPSGRCRGWLLALAALLALTAGGLYFWQWQRGLRGVDLLGFTSLYVCLPLALSLLLLFAALQRKEPH